jgi:hypothetical protein
LVSKVAGIDLPAEKGSPVSVENALQELFGRLGLPINLGDSLKAASDIAEALRDNGAPDSGANVLAMDAAEFSLVTRLATAGPGEMAGELNVTLNEFYTALEKIRCPWLDCLTRLAFQSTVADVIPFPGDLKKTGLDPGAQPDPTIFASAAPLVAIQAAYRGAQGVARYAAVADSPALFLQGGIWVLRAQVLRYPREFRAESADLEERVTDYIDRVARFPRLA